MHIKIARAAAGRREKVTLFGDSIPKGLFLEENRIKRIGRCASEIVRAHYGIELDNRSAFGMTLSKCAEKGYFSEYLKSAQAGEIAFIALGGNDCDYDWQAVARDPFGYHLPHTPLPLFCELLEKVIDDFAKAGIQAIFCNLPPISSQRYFERVISARADGAEVMKFFAGDVTNIARHQESYSNAITMAALANGCTLVDCRTEFLMKPDMLDYLSDDGIHPNQAGHDLIAECVIRQTQPFAARVREEKGLA